MSISVSFSPDGTTLVHLGVIDAWSEVVGCGDTQKYRYT